MLAKGMAGIAAIRHNPAGHTREAVEQRNGFRQFMRLTGRDPKRNGAAETVRTAPSFPEAVWLGFYAAIGMTSSWA
jgi:hypothetical protein